MQKVGEGGRLGRSKRIPSYRTLRKGYVDMVHGSTMAGALEGNWVQLNLGSRNGKKDVEERFKEGMSNGKSSDPIVLFLGWKKVS